MSTPPQQFHTEEYFGMLLEYFYEAEKVCPFY